MRKTICPECDGHGVTRSWRMSPEADCDLDTCRVCGGSGEIDPGAACDALMESDTPIGLNDDNPCDDF